MYNLYFVSNRKLIQRHESISGRGSISGASGGATAAAAAAAATAATATAYTHISSKLEGIESLISALKVQARLCRLQTRHRDIPNMYQRELIPRRRDFRNLAFEEKSQGRRNGRRIQAQHLRICPCLSPNLLSHLPSSSPAAPFNDAAIRPSLPCLIIGMQVVMSQKPIQAE